jgi:hypothetical protein
VLVHAGIYVPRERCGTACRGTALSFTHRGDHFVALSIGFLRHRLGAADVTPVRPLKGCVACSRRTHDATGGGGNILLRRNNRMGSRLTANLVCHRGAPAVNQAPRSRIVHYRWRQRAQSVSAAAYGLKRAHAIPRDTNANTVVVRGTVGTVAIFGTRTLCPVGQTCLTLRHFT